MEDSTPLVSCIIATNRRSPFLAEALRSIAAQTHPRIEIIVVDDGAPDSTALAREVDVVPGARLLHAEAGGVAAARNHGAHSASGDLLAFLDDDDRWDGARLERAVHAWKDCPGAVAVYGDMRVVDEDGEVIGEADQYDATRDDLLARRVTVMVPNLVVDARAFARIGGFDESLALAEDLDLVLRLAAAGQMRYAPGAVSDYRTHSANTTRRHRALARAVRQVLHARGALPGHERAAVESRRANDRFAWWSAGRAARTALGRGRVLTAVSEIAWAASFAPSAPLHAIGRRLRPGGAAPGSGRSPRR